MKRFITIAGTVLIIGLTIIACVGSYRSHNYSIQTMPASELHDVPERIVDIEYVEATQVLSAELFVPNEVPIIRTSEYINLTFEEMDLLERIAMAEAEGEDTLGKALVMCTVLNRSYRDGESIRTVIFKDGQYAVGRMYVEPTDDCHEALAMVMDGWNESMLDCNEYKDMKIYYFTNQGYSQYGEPMFQYGGHYFSGN